MANRIPITKATGPVTSPQYVALVQQGMVLDQTALAIGHDEQALRTLAETTAKALNDAQTGFGEGWAAVVLPVGKK